jgi:hypothetical protein
MVVAFRQRHGLVGSPPPPAQDLVRGPGYPASHSLFLEFVQETTFDESFVVDTTRDCVVHRRLHALVLMLAEILLVLLLWLIRGEIWPRSVMRWGLFRFL